MVIYFGRDAEMGEKLTGFYEVIGVLSTNCSVPLFSFAAHKACIWLHQANKYSNLFIRVS